MTPERWATIKSLFEQALQQPADQREEWIAASTSDAELLREVKRLLDAGENADRYFDTLGNRLRSTGEESAELTIPENIGPWQVLREAGRGGMGRVFEAVRDDGHFDQRVAIKVVDSHAPRLIARFERERRILADLDHPNICRLLDGGTLDDGRPYLVMEFVEGKPITTYCEEQGLLIPNRLELFIQVCDAVGFAHRRLVIHRDIKPSNVLVTEGGSVKLLDFGIARMLLEDGSPDQNLTGTGRRLLTPYFAAPEQILDGNVTTETDVYGLGVLLYVLLTRHHPFGETGGSPRVVEQEILEKTPTVPSSIVARDSNWKAQAGPRAFESGRWSKQLRGDLDRIVLKALRKEPERRYASPEDLARDIKRHRDGLPVEARPATFSYRAGSYLRRHRVGALITMVVLALTAVGSTVFTKRITAERDRATYVSDFLTDILARADDPASNPAALLPLLDPAVAKAENELASEPDAQAEVFQVVGMLYQRTGRSDRARHLLHRALSIRRGLHTGGHADIGETLFSLGKVFIGVDRDSSEYYFHLASEQYQAVSDSENGELAWSLLQHARMLPIEHPEKSRLFDAAMAMMRRVYGERSAGVADALHEYYVLGFGGGTTEDVEGAFEEAIAIYAENGLENNPYSIHAMHNLGLSLDARGEAERGLELLRRSVVLGKAASERGDEDRFAMEINLGATLYERGQYREADDILSEAARETIRYMPDSSSTIGSSHYWYGRNLIPLHRYDEAVEVLERAMGIFRHFDESSPYALRAQAELALAHFYKGDQEQAERLISDAVSRLHDLPFEDAALENAIVIYSAAPETERYRRRLRQLAQ